MRWVFFALFVEGTQPSRWLGRCRDRVLSKVLELARIILDGGHFSGGHDRDQGVLGGEGGVEVAHVEDVRRERGPHGRLDAPVQNLLVVQLCEPRVRKHFLEAAARPEPIRGVFLEQLSQQDGLDCEEMDGNGDLPA